MKNEKQILTAAVEAEVKHFRETYGRLPNAKEAAAIAEVEARAPGARARARTTMENAMRSPAALARAANAPSHSIDTNGTVTLGKRS